MELKIWTSGYYYSDRKWVFYPENMKAGEFLSFYSKYFNCCEINNTHYRTPWPRQLKNWYDWVPEDFSFSIKAPKLFSHEQKLDIDRQDINDFYSLIEENLQEKLGCILFQMPPSFHNDKKNLDLILKNLSNQTSKTILELSHKSWWDKKIYQIFDENNITFASVSYPNLPEMLVPSKEFLYIRLHGRPVLYTSPYGQKFIKSLYENIKKLDRKTWVVFNNLIDHKGLEDGYYLQNFSWNVLDYEFPKKNVYLPIDVREDLQKPVKKEN